MNEINVRLSQDQALVLSDWLDRSMGTARFDELLDDEPAVWSPIYAIAGTLDRSITAIFAPDYAGRLRVARQALLRERGHRPRRRPPVNVPAAQGEVCGWIYEQNVGNLFRHLSFLVAYEFDYLDEAALTGALDSGEWFEYPLVGAPELTVRLARDEGSSVADVVVSGEIDEILAARIDTVIMMLAEW